MVALESASIAFLNADGVQVATLSVVPDMPGIRAVELAPIVRVSPGIAASNGETEIQLRENAWYDYTLKPERDMADLRLRCQVSRRRRNVKPGEFDAGRIETGSFCGVLLLEAVEGEGGDMTKPALASALVDVRSVKLDYRSQYRAMLGDIATRMADLIADARFSSKVPFRSKLEESDDAGWFQVRLELLREILEGSEFKGVMGRILAYPHEALEEEAEMSPSNRSRKWTPNATRALVHAPMRRSLPPGHPLRINSGVVSVAERIPSSRKKPTLDTPENRFIKFVLLEFHRFLSRAQDVFSAAGEAWSSAEGLATRLSLDLEQWLARPFFNGLSGYPLAGLGSPVLQRKPGYRELLRWWLRYRASAELSWRGGEELFHAGRRDVARLYEYWLFFVFLDWFVGRFNQEGRPPVIQDLIDGLDDGSPNLRLKHHNQLGPFSGKFGDSGRCMYAAFSYNREFSFTAERAEGGSWTRGMHPDYTFTFWPVIEGMNAEEAAELAETQELLVHIHFDAKYRVENLAAQFGPPQTNAEKDHGQDASGNYKRQDLLKMHAYRDAIKRSEGAYVLYPGVGVDAVGKMDVAATNPPHTIMTGFHEVLPSLGAFAVTPDMEGGAQGFHSVTQFLEAVLRNVCDRASLREQRASALFELLSERRALRAKDFVETADLMMRGVEELDADGLRSPTPQQVMVIVDRASSNAERDWILKERFAVLRLGTSRELLRWSSQWAAVTHLLLCGPSYEAARGLYRIHIASGEIWSCSELIDLEFPIAAEDNPADVFAVVPIELDERFGGLPAWDGRKIKEALTRFSTHQRPTRANLLNEAYQDQTKPRIIALHDLQVALTD